MSYSAIAAPVAGLHLPIDFGGTSHAQHYVDEYPDTVMQIGMTMDPPGINLGLYDGQITVFADWLKNAGRPVYVRLGYEFNHANKGWDPAEYAAAFRHVVDRLRAEGVTNAAYVWHSTGHGSTNLDAWYPGDEYVDWVAVSIFHLGYASHPRTLEHANAMADFGAAHGKPMMLAETTPHSANTATADPIALWDNWHGNVADFVEARDVKAWSYINQDWEEAGWAGWGDSRVQNNPVLEDLWLTETGRDRYLQQSPDLYCRLGHTG